MLAGGDLKTAFKIGASWIEAAAKGEMQRWGMDKLVVLVHRVASYTHRKCMLIALHVPGMHALLHLYVTTSQTAALVPSRISAGDGPFPCCMTDERSIS